jgi:hypothetical protein
MHSDTKFGRRGDVSYTNARKTKVPECCSSLRPEKELLKQHSGTFHHKNEPG